VESLGRDKQLQIVQNLLRSKEGISDAGEAQKHAVQAQQRRERADRRKLVREMQSRAQLAPVATPSEQISECLTRSHSTPPVATSHGPSDRITVERESQNAGEVNSQVGCLKKGGMRPTATLGNKIHCEVHHKVQHEVHAEKFPPHGCLKQGEMRLNATPENKVHCEVQHKVQQDVQSGAS
jgi:hypothetical protein